jgi:anti-sigma regulatory factor (Ser/Thr protein kinase)
MQSATIAAGPGAPGEARALVTAWLDAHVSASVLDDARLLVSELVTNSLRHAGAAVGGPLRIGSSVTNGVVRLEVGDGGEDGAVIRRLPTPDNGAGGYGLHLVEILSSRWGVDHDSGTQVWFELENRPAA